MDRLVISLFIKVVYYDTLNCCLRHNDSTNWHTTHHLAPVRLVTAIIWVVGKEDEPVVCNQHMRVYLTPHTDQMVGLGRLELPTSPLSGVRSNQLSYKPIFGVALVPYCRAWSRHSSVTYFMYAPSSLLKSHTTTKQMLAKTLSACICGYAFTSGKWWS